MSIKLNTYIDKSNSKANLNGNYVYNSLYKEKETNNYLNTNQLNTNTNNLNVTNQIYNKNYVQESIRHLRQKAKEHETEIKVDHLHATVRQQKSTSYAKPRSQNIFINSSSIKKTIDSSNFLFTPIKPDSQNSFNHPNAVENEYENYHLYENSDRLANNNKKRARSLESKLEVKKQTEANIKTEQFLVENEQSARQKPTFNSSHANLVNKNLGKYFQFKIKYLYKISLYYYYY